MAHARPDLSSKLIHLVKGDTIDISVDVIKSILDQKKLVGNDGMIKGGWKCVCFTESPIAQLTLSLAMGVTRTFKYRPIGIMIDKAWAFSRGARPVIYETESEYYWLPEKIQYRHVTYEPHTKPRAVDFTWEREWRIRVDELPLDPASVSVIVPNRIWADVLRENHEDVESTQTTGNQTVITKRCPWHIISLEDMGIEVPDGLK